MVVQFSGPAHFPRIHLRNKNDMNTLPTILLPVAILCLTQTTIAQAPDWIWARNSGSVSNDYSNAVCTDAEGNVYITGTFQGSTITFGTHVLQNTSEGFLDFFVVKYDPQGNVIWAVSDGGTKDDYAYGICVDPVGNVFITGYFNSPTLAFGATTLVNTSTSVNAPDVLLAKYDPSGIALWGKSGEAEVAYAYGIGSDASGNVYITGNFQSSITFGTYTFETLLQYSYEMFLVKYDNDGNVLWANQMGGHANNGAQALHVDSIGNTYITGWFINSANFGSTSLVSTNNAYQEIFVAKFDINGNNIWANYAAVPYIGNYASGTGITADQIGNVYITGYFQYSLSFGNDTLGNAGNRGLFLAKYDSEGNPQWGRSPGGTGNDFGNGVCTDSFGNVIVTGYFASSFLNFGGFPVINSNVGYNDAFIARYDPDGNALGALGIGGADHEYGMAVATSPNGDIYSTGYFGSYALNFSGTVLTNSGSYDTYLAKLSRDGLIGVPTVDGHSALQLFPNPAHDHINLISEGATEVRVFDGSSRKILERQFTNTTTIDITGIPAGLYVYELIRNGTIMRGKFIRE